MAENSHALEDIMDEIDGLADERAEVSLSDVIDALDHRGYAPFLIVLPLLELSPVGGIPGVPTLLALTIALFAGQIAAGREDLWLPGWLSKRKVSSERLEQATGKTRPIARRLDSWFHGRLPWATRDRVLRIAAIVVLLLCLTVPPLELIPFASSAPMIAIALFGMAMLFHDGVLMIVAFTAAAAAAVTPIFLI